MRPGAGILTARVRQPPEQLGPGGARTVPGPGEVRALTSPSRALLILTHPRTTHDLLRV